MKNIDFSAAFDAGKTEEEIILSLRDSVAKELESYEEEIKRQAEARKTQSQAHKTKDAEALKAEGRAYLINAIIAYSAAFDPTIDGWDSDEIAQLEQALIRFEDMIPLYLKLAEMQDEFDLGKFFH